MARFEMLEPGIGAMGATAQADILFELGMMYATGRDCAADKSCSWATITTRALDRP